METRRGDIEILAYNLIHWLGGKLPWESKLLDPKRVQQSKEEHMSDIKKFLKASFDKPPSTIESLLKYINSLEFDDTPDYSKIHSLLLAGLKEAGGTLGKPLIFGNKKTPEKRNGTAIIAAGTPPKKARKARKKLVEVEEETEERSNSSTEENKKPATKKESQKREKVQENGYEGYTPAMIAILEKKQQRGKGAKAPKVPVASSSTGIAEKKKTLRVQQPVVYYDSEDGGTPVKATRKRKK